LMRSAVWRSVRVRRGCGMVMLQAQDTKASANKD
jgi:hypothetical protein